MFLAGSNELRVHAESRGYIAEAGLEAQVCRSINPPPGIVRPQPLPHLVQSLPQ